MNSSIEYALPFLRMLWRQKWFAVAVVWLVCSVGWIVSLFFRQSTNLLMWVYLNADPLLTPLLRGLAADTDPTRIPIFCSAPC